LPSASVQAQLTGAVLGGFEQGDEGLQVLRVHDLSPVVVLQLMM
jgi:hypothetical protein